MNGRFLFLAGLAGAIGVGAGAFGAHALRETLDADSLAVWETAVKYQLWHALALGLVALLAGRGGGRPVRAAGWLFAVGIVLFSGSLYGLAAGGPRWLGPVTPLGGGAFLAGWACLAFAGLSARAGSAGGRPRA